MNDTLPWTIDLCRGVRGECPNALPLPEDLLPRLDATLAASPWLQELAARRKSGLRPHQLFRVAVSACANGCSRPQVADLGLLGACRPQAPEACSGCGACVQACPDGLVEMACAPGGQTPVIDAGGCLDCGQCVRACPEGSMTAAATGLRVQLGGKLGRRPLLAAELPGVLDAGMAVFALERSLAALHAWNSAPDKATLCRLADLRRKGALAWLETAP